jgi:hypothetical protein
VTPLSSSVPLAGGTVDVAVTANDSTCSWKSTTDQKWLTLADGVGSKTVTFTVSENDTNAARSATVTVAGKKITINQAAPTNLIYGLTRAQAEKLYATLTSIPDAYNPKSNASYTSEGLGLPVTSPRYNFLQPGLTHECLTRSLGPDGSLYVTYDQLGAALGKPATMPAKVAVTPKATFKYGLTKEELDGIYQSLKAGKEKPYTRAGTTGVYAGGFQEEFSELRQLACNGMVRLPKQGNVDSNPNYGFLRFGWTPEVASTYGWYDITPDEYRRLYQIPHYFLAPTYVAGTVSGSGIGVEGQPQTVVFAPSEIFATVPFVTLEKDLGYAPSGAVTPGLYDDTPYIRTEQPKVATTTTATATTTTVLAPTTTVATAPAPTTAPTVALTTLYSQTKEDTHSNFNWNSGNDIYGWPWVPPVTGIPNKITLKVRSVTGTPTGNVCLAELSGTTPIILGCSSDVTFVSGDNAIAISTTATVTAGKMYFVKFTRTSDASNYPSFTYKYPGQLPVYRATAANSQPMTLWFTGDIAMIIEGTVPQVAAPAPTPTTTTTTPAPTTTTTATTPASFPSTGDAFLDAVFTAYLTSSTIKLTEPAISGFPSLHNSGSTTDYVKLPNLTIALLRELDPTGNYWSYILDAARYQSYELYQESEVWRFVIDHPFATGLSIGLVSGAIAYGGAAALATCVIYCDDLILIRITPDRINHVISRHFPGGAASEGKSLFSVTEKILDLIAKAEKVAPVKQLNTVNFERIVDAGRTIGIDRVTNQPTTIYTVITDAANNLITMFPGKP